MSDQAERLKDVIARRTAERDRLAADLARVTAERDALRNKLDAWVREDRFRRQTEFEEAQAKHEQERWR